MTPFFRRWAAWFWAAALRCSGALWWARRSARRRGLVLVLALHRVLDDPEARDTDCLEAIVLRTWRFRRLLAMLGARFDLVSLEAAAQSLGKPAPRLRAVLTFDDGWLDTYHRAWPIARDAGVPVAVFHCPGLGGVRNPFWPEHAAARLRASRSRLQIAAEIETLKRATPAQRRIWFRLHPHSSAVSGGALMNGAQLRELHAQGVTFGAHTMTHALLPCLGSGRAAWEVRASRAAIEDLLDAPCRWFAYPNGSFDSASLELAASAGFQHAFSCSPGLWSPATHPFAVPRVNISDGTLSGPLGGFSPLLFEYRVVWRAWRAWRRDSRPIPALRCGPASSSCPSASSS